MMITIAFPTICEEYKKNPPPRSRRGIMWLLFVKSAKMVCGEMANCIGWDRTTDHVQPHWMPQMYYILVGSEIKIFYDVENVRERFVIVIRYATVALSLLPGTLAPQAWMLTIGFWLQIGSMSLVT